MNLIARNSFERGTFHRDWLASRRTFRFADHHDPDHMGFRSLRAINQDRIAPGEGFPPHQGRDMEIFSYVLKGMLQHRDAMGEGPLLVPGQVRLVCAGSGVSRSEFIAARVETVHFLPLWIKPHTLGLEPSCNAWDSSPETDSATKILVLSPDGRDGFAAIHQAVDVWRIRLRARDSVSRGIRAGRRGWFLLIKGSVAVNGTLLAQGDAVTTGDPGLFEIIANDNAEALLVDLQ